MKRILVIEVNWIGDILFTTPAIRALKEANPGAFIGCLVVGRCVEMIRNNPHIDEIIIFDDKARYRGILGKLSLILELRRKRFDTVISFHRSMSRMLIAALAGISRRIGYYTRKRSWLLTDSVKEPAEQIHRVEYFLNILKAVGIDTKNKDYEFFIPPHSIENAEHILRAAGLKAGETFFVINPGGNWAPKRWPAHMYGQLCSRLKQAYGKKIVVTGAKKDIQLGQEIVSLSNNSAVSICGRTNLKELGAVMKKASVVITNDSGPMHIAVSQRTLTIALFGPTSPRITGPYGSSDYLSLHKWHDCDIPCYAICEDYRCMESISVEDVVDAVRKRYHEDR